MRNRFLIIIVFLLLGLLWLRGVVSTLSDRGLAPGARELQAMRATLEAAGRGVVRVAVSDLLSAPSEASSIADQARLGETLVMLPAPDGKVPARFVYVETRARYRGFVDVTTLFPIAREQPDYDRAGPTVAVTSRFANIYREADVTLHRPIVVAPLGARLRSLGALDERWLRVLLPGDEQGYVQRGDLSERPPGDLRLTAACVSGEALLYEGTAYLWGGRSTYGIDCSGLVANAFGGCGVITPRDAHQQHAWPEVVEVGPGELRRGDLLFFGARAPLKVSHVGIYLGEDVFVHATTHERPTVHRSRLSEPHWQAIFVGARRHPRMAQEPPAHPETK